MESCLRAALRGRDLNGSPQERLTAKIDRLRVIQDVEPESIWGKRANLATAVLLLEPDPAEAIRRLRAAQSDFPMLDDYLRFWTADALFRLGEASQAAMLFESVSAMPDSLLGGRAAFRAGEAWYRSGHCAKAIDLLARAVTLAPHDPVAPTAQFMLADCQFRDNRLPDSVVSFKQLWVRYPHAPEAREAATRLMLKINGEAWQPSPDDWLTRANTFLSLALHTEAVEEFQKFLAAAPSHPKRDEAKFKLGTALIRLKRYDQARKVYDALAHTRSSLAGEAAVWLARIHLRQDQGDRLLGLLPSLPAGTMSADQRAGILLFAGMWLDDHDQPENAIEKYQQAIASAEGPSQRLEALWRIGWAQYRHGRYQPALEAFERLAAVSDDPQWTPQALYWLARTQERVEDARAGETYAQLCRRYPFTYYCQLVQGSGKSAVAALVSVPTDVSSPVQSSFSLRKDLRYLKAVELKWIGADQDAAKELTALAERSAKDRWMVVELCGLLSEVGEHHQALRLARLYYRDPIERGAGDPVPSVLWSAAYPMAHLSVIRNHAGSLDPLLAAAIIREESQYDARALSRVGAVGLMQLMPMTAQTVAKQVGEGVVGREDLFDEGTNIRYGVRYLEQLLQQFSGNIIHAVAAYNAGPQAVSAWVAKYQDRPPDEFVELIPFQETRYYVKRVLRSYREYQRLAPASCEPGSLDKVC